MSSIYISDYRKKLTTPEKAAELIADDNTVVPGLNASEPPALLQAIANRLHDWGNKEVLIVHQSVGKDPGEFSGSLYKEIEGAIPFSKMQYMKVRCTHG